MSMPAMLTDIILGVATMVAVIRLVVWRRSDGGASNAMWRFLTLLALQPVCALSLYFTLFPPPATQPAGTLRIATAGTPIGAALLSGPPLIALPEAGNITGAQRLPDLATILRRHSDTRRIVILGTGLIPRDGDAARSVALSFHAPAPKTGIIALKSPPPTAPGAFFPVSGQLSGGVRSRVDLVDPAGRVTDSATPNEDGIFHLQGTARTSGLAEFSLRVKNGSRTVEEASIPVIVRDAAQPRLLIVAAAPNAEVKYLRRWASDAGFSVTTQMQTGAGVSMGDTPVQIDAATLSRLDAAIFDDRSWATLGIQRGAVLAAVANGLGLILHPGGPIDPAIRAQWQSLGFTLAGGNDASPLSLPPVRDPAVQATRLGIGSIEQPADMALPDDPLPDLSRLAAIPGGADTVPLLRDGSGTTIAAWRAADAGRIALFTPIDSYGLTLTGRRSLYENWWSGLLSTILRPTPSPTDLSDVYWAGEQANLCGFTTPATVQAPDGKISEILPVGSCGGYWPEHAGWHHLRSGGQARPFFVQRADALPSMRAMRDAETTQMLVSTSDRSSPAVQHSHPMPAWPFALLWLLASGLLWWLERSRLGRSTPPQSPM